MELSKNEVMTALATKLSISKTQAKDVLDAFTEVIVEALAEGNNVNIIGLLKVEVVERAAREGRNPSTGEKIKIAAKKAVKVTPGYKLKQAVEK